MPSIEEQVIVTLVFSLVPVSVLVALAWLIVRMEYRSESGEGGGGAGRGGGGGRGGGTSGTPLGPVPGGGSMRAGDDDLARSA